MPKISKRIVDGTEPGPKPFFVWDTTLPGFGLRVLPTGSRAFVFQYRTAEGRTRRATIAKVGSITPDKARERAEIMSDRVKDGGDPLDDKAAARAAPTMDALFDAYLASEKFAGKAESTRSIDRGRIDRHLRPLLGSAFAHKLTQEQVRRAFTAIANGKTAADVKTGRHGRAIVRGGEGTARHAIRLLRAIFAWGVTERLVTNNPAAGIAVGSDGERDVILDSPNQYERLFRTLDTMVAEHRVREPVADSIRVLALTGARRGEIINARWKHVDLRKGVITLPPASHKTGTKTGKARVIGLPAAAQAIIARQVEGEADDYVFRPAKGNGPINLAKPWRAIRSEAGLPEGIGLHGLRHSLASSLAMAGAQAAEIMTAMGHRKLETARKYIHWAEDARSTLAERAAATALAGLDAAGGGDAGDVVDMPATRQRTRTRDAD